MHIMAHTDGQMAEQMAWVAICCDFGGLHELLEHLFESTVIGANTGILIRQRISRRQFRFVPLGFPLSTPR